VVWIVACPSRASPRAGSPADDVVGEGLPQRMWMDVRRDACPATDLAHGATDQRGGLPEAFNCVRVEDRVGGYDGRTLADGLCRQ
jgi:hypothetical protein